MRFARGPFWLDSISNWTRSPPASESKFTFESRPVRWKKYSFPSSAAMKPNPRSETNFLIVPVGIDSKPPFSKACRERTGPFENSDAGDRPRLRGHAYLSTRSRGQQRDSGKRRDRSGELDRRAFALPQTPHAPNRDGDDRDLADRRDHGQRREAQRPQHKEVARPEEQADHARLPPRQRHDRIRRAVDLQRRRDPD